MKYSILLGAIDLYTEDRIENLTEHGTGRIKHLAAAMDKDQMHGRNLHIYGALLDAINDLDRCIERLAKERVKN